MKKTTRILSLILAAVMILSCFSGITVSAAGGRKLFSRFKHLFLKTDCSNPFPESGRE